MAVPNEIWASALPTSAEPKDTASLTLPAFLASLLSASIAAYLCCQLPVSVGLTPAAFLFRAFAYVSVVGLAGSAGAWFYWDPAKAGSAVSLRHFILWCGAGWLWAPAIVLTLQHGSLWVEPLTVFGATTLARGLSCFGGAANNRKFASQESKDKELFTESIQPIPWDWHATVISVCIYTTFFALQNHAPLAAFAVTATGSFLFVRQLTNGRNVGKAHELRRLVANAIAVTLITTFALWVSATCYKCGSVHGIANLRGHGSGDGDSHPMGRPQGEQQTVGGFGYQSIVLWPLPPKKEIIAPLLASSGIQGVHVVKPIIIPFEGSYWYFQPPETRPGLHAHVAQGDPLKVNIHATNFMPLVMQAHQVLDATVRISRCREIQVVIENRDSQPGGISAEMLLTDSLAPGKPTLSLGRQLILSSESDRVRRNLSPVIETLRFPIPSRSSIHRFDQITLVVGRDRTHPEVGAKVALQQFKFLPR